MAGFFGLAAVVLYVLVFIVILVFLVIVLSVRKPKGRPVDVRVLSCEQNTSAGGLYETKVDFYGPNGEVLIRTLRSVEPHMPGDVIRCRYIGKTGLLMTDIAPEVKRKSRNSVLLFLVVFLVITGIAVAAILTRYAGKDLPNKPIGYFIGILFVAVSIFGIRQKIQLKRKMQDMISLPGIQVDYEMVKDYTNDRYVRSYRPIYEYEWGGEKKRIYSRLRSTGTKYRTIGRGVHILVDPQTGKAVCQEDEKTSGAMYLFFGIVGLATLALMLALSFGIL